MQMTPVTSSQAIPSFLLDRTPAVFDLPRSGPPSTVVPPSNQKLPSNSLSSLLEEAIEVRHRQRNWDGEDAEPITNETLSLTRTFLQRVEGLVTGRSLKRDVELDIMPEPSGEIGIDWFIDHEHTLSVGVINDSPGGVYYFACRYGGVRRTGKSPANLGIPDDLGQLIRRFYE